MSPEYTDILTKIVQETQSDIILFTIVIIVGLALVFIPFYYTSNKSKKMMREQQLEEKKQLINVVEKNTDAISTLKTTLELTNSRMLGLLKRIDDSTSETSMKMEKLLTIQEGTTNKIDKLLHDHEKINVYTTENKDVSHELALVRDETIKAHSDVSDANNTIEKVHEQAKNVEQKVDELKDILTGISNVQK